MVLCPYSFGVTAGCTCNFLGRVTKTIKCIGQIKKSERPHHCRKKPKTKYYIGENPRTAQDTKTKTLQFFKCENEPKLAKSALFSPKEKPYGRDWFRACLKLISWFRVMLQAMFICFYYIHVGHIVACCTYHTPNYLTCILVDFLQDDLASLRVEKLTGGELQ